MKGSFACVYARVSRRIKSARKKKGMNMSKQTVSIRGDSNLLIVQHTFLFLYIILYLYIPLF